MPAFTRENPFLLGLFHGRCTRHLYTRDQTACTMCSISLTPQTVSIEVGTKVYRPPVRLLLGLSSAHSNCCDHSDSPRYARHRKAALGKHNCSESGSLQPIWHVLRTVQSGREGDSPES